MANLKLTYKGLDVSIDLYTLEYVKDNEQIIEIFKGAFAYQKAVIRAKEINANGFLCYPLTRSKVYIINGDLRKRGRKKQKKTDELKRKFFEIKPDQRMQPKEDIE